MPSEPLSELMQAVKDLSDHLDKPKGLKIELDLQSPYNPCGSPRTDLPTGEVLAWDGEYWITGVLKISEVFKGKVDAVEFVNGLEGPTLFNITRFAPLPTIIEDENRILQTIRV